MEFWEKLKQLRVFLRFTDLGFVVRTVHCLGEMGIVVLLAYQTYTWNRKKKKAIKKS